MKTALIIPAYKPGKEMLDLLEQFHGNGDFHPIVVDDGSGVEFAPIFDAVPDFAVLLRHEVNRGKGAALKTAMAHILANMPECELALTADADGQHRYGDILKVRDAALAHPGQLVLGSRAFDGNVPLRSRFGNSVTRWVFAIASGTKVRDTQTGLRVFNRSAMERFVQVSGDRYEYEINMLLDAAASKMGVYEETIETVYLNDNESSHFNPLKDSIKIYKCIFKFCARRMGSAIKFCASSLLAFVIDYVMVLLLAALTKGLAQELGLLISVVGARFISGSINFYINRNVVFKGNETLGKAIAKYVGLALGILCANYALMYLLTVLLRWPLPLAKLLVEATLFIASYFVQKKFVYRSRKG